MTTSVSISTLSTISINDSYFEGKFQSKIFPQVFAAFAATISAFGMGTVEAYTSPALPSMEESGKLGNISEAEKAQVASIALLAALVSGPPIGFLIGKIGRKVTLSTLAVPFVAGWLLIATSDSLNSIYFGRLLTGFCAGAASLVVPIFIGEIAEDRVRGMLCSGFQVMVTLGNLFVYVLGTYLDWQWLAFFCGIIPLFGLLLMVITSPTPQFLISRGRVKDAGIALARLRGAKSTTDVEFELFSMQENLKACKEERKSYKDVFKMRTIRPLLITLLLLFFQQMTGIEAVLVYTVYIFKEGGGCDTMIKPNQSTIIVGALQVITTVVSAILVDKSGRRILLIISEIGTSFAMMVLAIFFYFKDNDPIEEQLSWVPLASLTCFIISFSIGCGNVPFLMVAELNSPAVIGIASAAATTFNWTFAYLITAFFMDFELLVGLHWCFGMFSAFSLLGAVFVYIFVPETKGISMDEIQNYFRTTKAKVSKVGVDNEGLSGTIDSTQF